MTKKRILKNFYRELFPSYEKELEGAIGNCSSVLDVGCGNNSPIKTFSKGFYSIGVDLFQPSIEESKTKNIHNKYVQCDVLEIDDYFPHNSIECVLASDLIEHLEKEDGLKLLSKMEDISSKSTIIFTPNGFIPQGEHEGNPWQIHKSGWTPEEMRKLGYRVIGINGAKFLRGELSNLKIRPLILGKILSDASQLFVKTRPKYAFSMLCVKNKIANHRT